MKKGSLRPAAEGSPSLQVVLWNAPRLLLRKGLGRRDVLPSLAVERVKEFHQIALFLVRQVERNNEIVLVRILDATLIVEIHDFFKSFEASVMHIRRASSDLA